MEPITIHKIIEIIKFTFDDCDSIMIRYSIPKGTTNHDQGFNSQIVVVLNNSLILHYNFYELAALYGADDLSSFLIEEKERLRNSNKL